MTLNKFLKNIKAVQKQVLLSKAKLNEGNLETLNRAVEETQYAVQLEKVLLLITELKTAKETVIINNATDNATARMIESLEDKVVRAYKKLVKLDSYNLNLLANAKEVLTAEQVEQVISKLTVKVGFVLVNGQPVQALFVVIEQLTSESQQVVSHNKLVEVASVLKFTKETLVKQKVINKDHFTNTFVNLVVRYLKLSIKGTQKVIKKASSYITALLQCETYNDYIEIAKPFSTLFDLKRA